MTRSAQRIAVVLLISVFGVFRAALGDELQRAKLSCKENVLRGLWTPEEATLYVIVGSRFDQELQGCVRRLEIATTTDTGEQKTLYSEEMAEVPVALVPVAGRLVTVWGSGSAYWIAAFGIVDGQIVKVLDLRPKGMPEIVFSKLHEERLIVTHYGRDGQPVSSNVYLWTGKRYVERNDVPWTDRFNGLQ